MNRPRNKQHRPPRLATAQHSHQRRDLRPPTPSNVHVPTAAQVVTGAVVSIVLKADQSTGRQVQGVVKDLLTRGDHPRGIKVRLQDGRVGRVQRLAGGVTPTSEPSTTLVADPLPARDRGMVRDVRQDLEYMAEPPPRRLADFIPDVDSQNKEPRMSDDSGDRISITVQCPICTKFEGDEAAVSHHVEEHFTEP